MTLLTFYTPWGHDNYAEAQDIGDGFFRRDGFTILVKSRPFMLEVFAGSGRD